MKRNRERLTPEERDKRIDDAIGRGNEAEKEFWKLLEEEGMEEGKDFNYIGGGGKERFADFRVRETFIDVKAHLRDFIINIKNYQKVGEQRRGVYVFRLKEKEGLWGWLEHQEVGKRLLQREGKTSTLKREYVIEEGKPIKLLIEQLKKQK